MEKRRLINGRKNEITFVSLVIDSVLLLIGLLVCPSPMCLSTYQDECYDDKYPEVASDGSKNAEGDGEERLRLFGLAPRLLD